tara:strand:+ start:19 stop:291 length:273 start_codon:yes stop_codon:yes gene_type:complete
MYKKIKNIFIILSFFTFIILITKYYFSEENKILTNKSRTSYSITLDSVSNNLPLLKNDTKNIIFHINDLEKFEKKRKKRFWEKLISSKNE